MSPIWDELARRVDDACEEVRLDCTAREREPACIAERFQQFDDSCKENRKALERFDDAWAARPVMGATATAILVLLGLAPVIGGALWLIRWAVRG